MGAILIAIIAFVSLFVPGVLLALALLKKTDLHIFEILTMGFVFGLIFPATLTWIESYAESSIHFFTFSLGLFEINCLILTIIGLILCLQQGVFKKTDKSHEQQQSKQNFFSNKMVYVWIILLAIMLLTFATRMVNIGVASHYFEFDPYFDLIDAKSILTLGHQMLLDPSSWPVVAAGTNHRIQPILPYLEAYWYSLANSLTANSTAFSTNLMSLVSSFYPPITAALLVFVIFMLLYHEYNAYIGLIGAGLTATMSVLFTTFIAGEQLLEPWGIFSLFLFFATYMLATKNMKNKRYAILAGIAFASTFLGSHYFTVDTGILMLYIVIQGIIDILRGNLNEDFYKMNIIVIAVIGFFLVFYDAYKATPTNLNLSFAGIPFTFAGPVLALLFIAIVDYVPKLANRWEILKSNLSEKKERLKVYGIWLVIVIILSAIFIFAGPLHRSVDQYIAVSVKFTSPSSALFATVQEYEPTGIAYNYAAAGLGMLAAEILGLPLLLWLVCAAALIVIVIAIIFRNSRTGVLYLAISLPLMYAGMKEAKYLPHFAAVYIMLFCILLGELLLYADHKFKIGFKEPGMEGEQEKKGAHINQQAKTIIYAVGLFFISTILGVVYLIYSILGRDRSTKGTPVYAWGALIGLVFVFVVGSFATHSLLNGSVSSMMGSITAAINFNPSPPTTSCNNLANQNNDIGYSMFCNNVPQYWINATAWMRANVGPFAPRILAWWDYGDWINWFGNSNAVLRGDNSVPKEDYATAAMFVLSKNDNYTTSHMKDVMDGNQTQYVLFDEDLVGKWGALDFLGCVDVNETSLQYALAQGAAQSPPQPYVLGDSPCELSHDPQYALIPLQVLIPSSSSTQQLQDMYCGISNQTATYVTGYLVTGQTISNQTVCVNINNINKQGALQVYNSSGQKINAMINLNFYQGVTAVGSQQFVQFLMIYTPNGANGTITDPPTAFYTSNFYNGFFLGKLAGFNLVYPLNSPGTNFVNGTYPIRMFKLINYTGGLPPVLQKPSWVKDNYTVP
jgi:MFS family permease